MAANRKVCYVVQGSLAERVRLLRLQRGLTLEGASAQIGIDSHTLSRVERGVQKPHAPTLKKIAAGYGVSVEGLVREPVPLGEADLPKAEAPTWPPPAEERRYIKDLPDNALALLEDLRREVQRWLEEWRSMIRAGVDMSTAVTIKLASYQVHNHLDLSGAFDITNVVFEAREAGEAVPEDLLTRVVALQNVVQSPSGLRSIGDEAIFHASQGEAEPGQSLKDSILLRQSG